MRASAGAASTSMHRVDVGAVARWRRDRERTGAASASVVHRRWTTVRRRRASVTSASRSLDASTSWDESDDDVEAADDGADAGAGPKRGDRDAVASARVDVMASAESVWRSLQRGENLSKFVPTLLVSKLGPKQYGSTETEVRLLALDYTLFTPRMLNTVSVRIVDKSKGPPNWENGPAKLAFVARNVDERSDFTLVGSFCIFPIFGESYKCRVEYRAELKPLNYTVPSALLRRAVEDSIPFVIASLTKQAVKNDQRRLRSPAIFAELETSPFSTSKELAPKPTDSLTPSGYLGLSEVSVPSSNVNSSQDEETTASTVRMRPRGEQGITPKANVPKSWRAIGGGSPGEKWFSSDITTFENPGALEVHMRRYDTESLLHRRALAAVRVEAPPALIWDLLTTYENMPQYVPHLMHVEFIQRYNAKINPSEGEAVKRLRLRHVFVKCELFHAVEEAVGMDVVQKDDRTELQFRILQNPKFGALQGKWLVVPTEDSKASVLKFAIEGVVRRENDMGTKVLDPLNERIVFEEISTMLKQARDFMENIANMEVESFGSVNIKIADLVLKGEGMSVDEEDIVEEQTSGTLSSSVVKRRSEDSDEMLRALREELIGLGFGEDGLMPTREQLRAGRHWVAIEKIESLGGFVRVAQKMDWTGAKTRPRGYWSLNTLELEINEFIANSDVPSVRENPGVMPSQKVFREAGLADIVNALKRFGGAGKVATRMNLEFKRASKPTRK